MTDTVRKKLFGILKITAISFSIVVVLLFAAFPILAIWYDNLRAPNRNNWSETITIPVPKCAIEEAFALAEEYNPKAEFVSGEYSLSMEKSKVGKYHGAYSFLCPEEKRLPRGMLSITFVKSSDVEDSVRISMDYDVDPDRQFEIMTEAEARRTETTVIEHLQTMQESAPASMMRLDGRWWKRDLFVTAWSIRESDGENVSVASQYSILWNRNYDITEDGIVEKQD